MCALLQAYGKYSSFLHSYSRTISIILEHEGFYVCMLRTIFKKKLMKYLPLVPQNHVKGHIMVPMVHWFNGVPRQGKNTLIISRSGPYISEIAIMNCPYKIDVCIMFGNQAVKGYHINTIDSAYIINFGDALITLADEYKMLEMYITIKDAIVSTTPYAVVTYLIKNSIHCNGIGTSAHFMNIHKDKLSEHITMKCEFGLAPILYLLMETDSTVEQLVLNTTNMFDCNIYHIIPDYYWNIYRSDKRPKGTFIIPLSHDKKGVALNKCNIKLLSSVEDLSEKNTYIKITAIFAE